MKLFNRTLLAGLFIAVVSVSGAAQATTALDGAYAETTNDAGLTAPESKATLGPSATLPELPSWALVLLGFGIMGIAGNQQAKKRREAIAYF
jgi:hypothetical protein